MRVYLAGPINGRTNEDCVNWRGEAMMLRKELVWLSPMARDYRGREDENADDIVKGDLADIEQCDVLLVNASLGASWGTAMEIVYARNMGKRVVVIFGGDGRISPWLRYHADAIFSTVRHAVESL